MKIVKLEKHYFENKNIINFLFKEFEKKNIHIVGFDLINIVIFIYLPCTCLSFGMGRYSMNLDQLGSLPSNQSSLFNPSLFILVMHFMAFLA